MYKIRLRIGLGTSTGLQKMRWKITFRINAHRKTHYIMKFDHMVITMQFYNTWCRRNWSVQSGRTAAWTTGCFGANAASSVGKRTLQSTNK